MEYKYYKRDGENYMLKRPMGYLYIGMALIFLTGSVGIAIAIVAGGYGGYIWFLCCMLFIYIGFYKQKIIKVYIQPSKRTILIKRGSKIEKQYSFDEFLNFLKTSVRGYGITTQWHVFIVLNETGKNKRILLGTVLLQRTADSIIAETDILLKEGKSAHH